MKNQLNFFQRDILKNVRYQSSSVRADEQSTGTLRLSVLSKAKMFF
jgi:hypothetical protein